MKNKVFILASAVVLGCIGYAAYQNWHNAQQKKNSTVTHYTRAEMDSIQTSLQDKKYRAPKFENASLLKDVPSAKVWDEKLQKEVPVSVWDSWPVTDRDGAVANYHGYRLVIGLTAKGDRGDDSGVKLGMYAQKISDKEDDISTWKYLGDVFSDFGEGRDLSKEDYNLDHIKSEWSGSTTMMNSNDQTLRLFYTNAWNKEQRQALTTAQIAVEPKDGTDWASGLTINHQKATDHKTVFTGDGEIYQKAEQAVAMNGVTDSFAMRDPHFVIENGKYYLAFEGNTGPKSGDYQGDNNFKQSKYYGLNAFFKTEKKRLEADKKSEEYARAYLSNSAMGKIELNSDFTLKKVMKPMVTSNATHDMMERPNLVKYKGRWYLFASVWGIYFATSDQNLQKQNFMLGWVSDDGINGTYKPLNGNALVLASSLPMNAPDFTYSYLALPSNRKDKSEFVVTAFQANKTFAPSIRVKVNGDRTSVVNNSVLNQGAVIDSGHYYQAKAQKINY
ncbi:glycoside hydrolase family 68 protein [Fructobacillus sp. W13]|uniref:Glycoside hydrolase family 68 protein n=1 Tax=Fructobacillus apis TaxID=2935017 RepID=A0ABT0ZNZ7_9LACO|nr:glycoside hydrolase family 68 protein [Fructobacillus apis]MCO0831675.1 glycoside hydrolase family 68 protein [Fructobacillus apis]